MRFTPVEAKRSSDSPDFTVQFGGVELGAASKATARSGSPFVRAVTDDPSFPVALVASLVENREGKFSLLWSRQG